MKMKFTVQKIIATLVVAAITIGLFPKILGNDKVNAAGSHSITVTNGKAYDTDFNELTSAEEGKTIFVRFDTGVLPADKYYDLTSTPEASVTLKTETFVVPTWSFTMPDNDVTVEFKFSDATPYTIDLTSGSATVPDEVMQVITGSAIDSDGNLDGVGDFDIHVKWTPGSDGTITKLASATITDSYVKSNPTLKYKPVTYIFSTSVTEYPLWVSGVQVTSANKDDILGDGGKAKFDPDTSTLTLNDPAIAGSHEDALIYSEGIDLTLEGSATFSSSSFGAIKVVKNGTSGGVLTLNGDFKIEEVHSSVSAVLADNGINVTGGKITNTSGKYGLKTDGNISISGGEVNAFGTEWAIYAKNDISITGGKIWAAGYGNDASGIFGNDVTITSGEITIGAGDEGLICHGHLEISGGSLNATITGQTDASNAICADSISISGGEITVSLSIGDAVVSSDGDMSISNATVSVMSYNGAGILVFRGELNINSGTVSATSKCPSNPAKSYGVYVFDEGITIGNDITSVSFSGDAMGLFTPFNLILGDKLIIKSPENGKLNTAGNCIIGSDGKAAKTVTLVPQTGLTTYPVWVGNTQVTSANKDDILGDGGKAKYDPDTNTLTLNNPTISGTHEQAMIYSKGIDLIVEGNAALNNDYAATGFTIEADGSAGGTLTLNGNFTIGGSTIMSAVWADKKINIIDGQISNSNGGWGLNTDGDITISGGEVNALGGACAINADNSISITGGTVEARSTGDLGTGIGGNDVTISSGIIKVAKAGNGIIAINGLTIEGGTINVDVEGKVENNIAIGGQNITITGGDITAKIGTGCAIRSSNGDMDISSANVTAESNKGNGISVWHGKLTISSGTVSATGKGTDSIGIDVTDSSIMIANGITSVSATGDLKGISGYFKIMLGDELDIATPASGSLSADEKTIVESDGTTIAKTVKIVHHVGPINYPVWVGNTQVTSVNKDDILGDGGKAKYYPDSKTLVFDDPTISSYGLYGSNVYFEQDINIEGTLTITGGQFGIIDDGYKHNITINGDINVDVLNDAIAAKDIEIKGGKVNLNSQKSNAIIGQNITLSGGYVNAATSSTTSYAIVSAGGGDIVISGGTVTATSASQYTINSLEGKVIIANGASRVEAKGTGEAISADKGIEIGEVLNITTPSDGVISSDGKFVAESDGTTPADHVVIERDTAKFPVTVVITTWDKDNNCISEVGGTVTGAPTVTKKGDTIEVNVTPKDGYEIVEISFGDGLISTQTGMSTKFTVPADYTPLSDKVQIDVLFRAKAATPSTYTVTFNTDGGSAVAAQTVTSGAKATKPADPAKEGFTFDGWYKDAAFTTAFDFNTAINSDVTVYAKWKENATTPAVYYTVVSGANGTCTQGTDFVMQIKRSENDEKTYSDYFTGVKIDDKLLVNGTDYTAAPGSVIVTIKGSTLSDLTVGGHTVTIEFKDGTAVTSLNVKAAANVVKTGEDMSPALWTGVACVGSAVMLFAAVVTQKKRTAVRQTVRKSIMKF